MTKPQHSGKTAAQRRVLDEIGCGNSLPNASKKVFEALLKAGLIEQCGDKVLGRDRFGVITVPQFEMTIPTHMAWCKAVAAEDSEGDEF